MPKAQKKSQLARGISDVTIAGPTYPLIARSRGPQTSRNPRGDYRFWAPTSLAVKTGITPVFRRWLREGMPESFKPDYEMSDLDRKVEETAGNALLLAGPIIDFYLTKVGGDISLRLRRSSGTGLATFENTVPPTVFSQLMYVMKQYGGRVDLSESSQGGGMYGRVEVKISSVAVLRKVFSGTRADGRNFLAKLHFIKERTPDKQVISHYRGKTVVVATEARPFRLHYTSSTGRLIVTFYRQKFDRNGLAINTVLQAALS